MDRPRLTDAIAATFVRRNTPVPAETPVGLTGAFAQRAEKRAQWQAFLAGVAVDPGPLIDVVAYLADTLMPVAASARRKAVNWAK